MNINYFNCQVAMWCYGRSTEYNDSVVNEATTIFISDISVVIVSILR